MPKANRLGDPSEGAQEECLSIEQIVDYVDDRLSEYDRSRVESHLRSCDLCKDTAEGVAAYQNTQAFQRCVAEVSRRVLVHRALQAGKSPHKIFRWGMYTLVAALSIAAAVVVLFNLQAETPHAKLIGLYFERYPSTLGQPRDLQSESHGRLEQALEFYNDEKDQQALDLFTQILVVEPENATANFYTGIISLSQKKSEQAIRSFENVLSIPQHDFQQAILWYLALAYLQKGDLKTASQLLSTIVTSRQFYHRRATDLLRDIEALDEAQEMQDEIGISSPKTGLDSLLAVARQFSYKARYDSTIIKLLAAKEILDKSNAREISNYLEAQIRLNSQLADAYRKKFEFSMAKQVLRDEVPALDQLAANNPALIDYYLACGYLYFDLSRYDSSRSYFAQAQEIASSVFIEDDIVNADINYALGLWYWKNQYLDQALEYQTRALEIRRQHLGEMHPDMAESYRMVGRVYWYLFDLDQAELYLKKALNTGRLLWGEHHPFIAVVYTNLAHLSRSERDYDQASIFLQRALAIGPPLWGATHYDLANLYYNIALVNIESERMDAVVIHLEEALRILNRLYGETHIEVSNCYELMGVYYQAMGQLDKAVAYYKKTEKVRAGLYDEQHPWIDTSNRLAMLYSLKGDFDTAIAYHDKVLARYTAAWFDETNDRLAHLESVRRPHDLFGLLRNKAEALEKRYKKTGNPDDLKESLETCKLLSEVARFMTSDYKGENSRFRLGARALHTYRRAIRVAYELYVRTKDSQYIEAAFSFAEKSKMQSFLQTTQQQEVKNEIIAHHGLEEPEQQLREALITAEINLAIQRSQKPVKPGEVAYWENRRFEARQKYDAFWKELAKMDEPVSQPFLQFPEVAIDDVVQALPDTNHVLLEYVVAQNSIWIFTLSKQGLSLEPVERMAGISAAISTHVEHLRRGILESDLAAYLESASWLYQKLIRPVADKVGAKNIYVVPDGMLHLAPFEVLLKTSVQRDSVSGNYARLPFLIKEHTISYVPSASLLAFSQPKEVKYRKDYLALVPVFPDGIPEGTLAGRFFQQNLVNVPMGGTRITGRLPASKGEVQGILELFKDGYDFSEDLFGHKSKVLFGKAASESRLKRLNLGQYRFIHFATHGFSNENEPLLCGLMLADNHKSTEDNILRLGEIYQLRLNAELVVLSACETGLGKIVRGEGVVGLSRGFLAAGARSLLTSLWQVNDASTSQLMRDFFDNMLSGKSKPEALREAKLKLMASNPEFAKPFYWAPFVLINATQRN